MKILVVSPYAVMNATFETDLEVIQDHLDAGDEVTLLGCDAELFSCFPNSTHHLGLCVQCISRRGAGMRALTRAIERRPLLRLTPEDRAEISGLFRPFASVADLGALTLEKFDIGWGVLSSVVSITVDPEPDVSTLPVSDLVRRTIISSASVYRSVQHYLDEIRPERVYVFNGRFAETRAVLRAAQSREVDCYMTERGSSFNHYMLFKNQLSHEPDFFQDLIRQCWAEGDPEERAIMGASFFIDSARGVSHTYSSFIPSQKRDALPEGFDRSKNNVAVFASSDFEFAAVREILRNPLYRDQYEGLGRVVDDCKSDPDIRLWIRMHPNAAGMKRSVIDGMMAMGKGNAVAIPPGSNVSTYALMRAATRVLTFGSTTGIEAVYWGTPSILGNRSYYDTLGGTYNPSSHAELMALLRAPALAPKDKEGALVYGYFSKVHGYRFRHFNPTGLGGGPFRGVTVAPTPAARIAARALRRLASPAGRLHLQLLERGLAR